MSKEPHPEEGPSPTAEYCPAFFGAHIAAEHGCAGEDLPVQAILDRLAGFGCVVSDGDRRRLLDQFFGIGECDDQLHLPLSLEPVQKVKGARGWSSLTLALQAPVPAGQPAGIALAAPAGAGKTLAAIRAFRDVASALSICGGPSVRSAEPKWLPVRLRTSASCIQALAELEDEERTAPELALEDADQVAGPLIVHELLAQAAGLDAGNSGLISRELADGLRLVIFIDLNEISSEAVRYAVARSLRLFQATNADRVRCVAAYRSSQDGDDILGALAEPVFRAYDLATIEPGRAVGYLRRYRRFEQQVDSELGRSRTDRDVDAECAKLERFLSRHGRGKGGLISTPLVMHLFAVLDAGRMSQVESLADLYGVVTEELLAGQERRHGMSPHQTGEMRSGPARMALVHDSFLDYFQARDLHAHLGLEAVRMAEDLDPRWAHEVVASVRADPSGWFCALEFLGGLLTPEQIESLLMAFLLVDDAPVEWSRLLESLARRQRPLSGCDGAPSHDGRPRLVLQ